MSEENKALVRREAREIYSLTGNLDAADEIYAPDYVSRNPTGGAIRGIECARQYAAVHDGGQQQA